MPIVSCFGHRLRGVGWQHWSIRSARGDQASVARGKTAFMRKEVLARFKDAFEMLSTSAPDSIGEKFEEGGSARWRGSKRIEHCYVPKSLDRFKQALKTLKASAKETSKKFDASYAAAEAAFSDFKIFSWRLWWTSSKTRWPPARQSAPAAANEFTAEFIALKTSMGVKFPAAWADPGDREGLGDYSSNIESWIQKRDASSGDENGGKIDGPLTEFQN